MPQLPARLYIIDDEPAVRAAYARLARSAKMVPSTFESVEAFMAAEESNEGACVICDVRMPGRSGLELPALLERAGKHLPVIFVTSHDSEELREAARSGGAAGYFRKPVDDAALLDAIAWVFAKQEP